MNENAVATSGLPPKLLLMTPVESVRRVVEKAGWRLEDVDLFEITNPRAPVKLSETRLPGVRVDAYGQEKTAHDFDVLQFPDGRWHLMVSDWDAGWIDVDVTDPENPVIVGDHDYEPCDALIPTACPPEGNAHQGEWNGDGSLFLGTDEDSSPFRLPITITDGPLAGQNFAAGEFGWTKQVASFPDGKINGPMVFGGYGCPGSSVPDPSVLGTLGADEEAIIVFQRGPVNDPNNPGEACFFSDKVRSGEGAGYDVVAEGESRRGLERAVAGRPAVLFVDLPGAEAREQIIAIHLSKRGRDPAAFEYPEAPEPQAGFPVAVPLPAGLVVLAAR